MSLPDTVAAAAEVLALRAAAYRQGEPRLEKTALEKTAILGALGGALQNMDPARRSALIGALGGAGLGLGSSLMRDKEDRHTSRSMLTGALAGGALGGGLGMAMRPKAPGSSQTRNPNTTFDVDGRTMKLKPDAKITPETAKYMDKLDRDRKGHGILGHIPILGPALGLGGAVADRRSLDLGTPSSLTTRRVTRPAVGFEGQQARGVPGDADYIPPYQPPQYGPATNPLQRHLQRAGYQAELDPAKDFALKLPKSLADRESALSFRGSRLNQLTGGYLGRPEILAGSWRDRLGTGAKGLGATLGISAVENLLRDKLQSTMANRRYHSMLSQYAEPTGG